MSVSNNEQKNDGQEALVHQQQHEVRYRAAPTWTRALQWAIVGCIGFGFIYTVVARIDEVVIARGELKGMGAERPIKAPMSGVVSGIPVTEGELVSPGQVLVQFDSDVSNERLRSLKHQKELESRRLRKEIQAFEARVDSLRAQLRSLKETLKLEATIVDRMAGMVREGAIAEVQYLQKKNGLQELQSEIAQTEATLREVQAESIKSEQQIQRELADLERQLVETNKSQEYESLRAPVKGYVFDLVVASPGYAARSGETLLKIVPDGALEASVFVTNADVGFLRPKMQAQVRVDAYPFTQYGDIPGELKRVGKQSLEPSPQNPEPMFPAQVVLKRQYLEKRDKRYPVAAGQSVSVNFIVRDKPVISLLTDSIEKAFDALRGIKTDQS